MNYFLLANNNNFDWSILDTIVKDTDILVVFNFLIPLKNKKILSHPNKICFSRKRPTGHRQNSSIYPGLKEFYCNMSMIKTYQNKFKEIYFVPCTKNIKIDAKSYIDNINAFEFNKEKIKCMPYDLHTLRQKLKYPGIGIRYEVSTGIIAYDFLKQENPYNKIILVGFTSELSIFHEAEWERLYFLNEIYNNNCYTINSYGFTNYP
jgi:hypothetical protein